MRKLSLYIATSIDGYIARPDGSVAWLEDIPNPDKSDFGYSDFIKTVDTTLMGGATYRQILTFGDWPYKDKRNFVFSRSTDLEHPYASFINEDVVAFTEELKSGKGKDIWLIGGAEINNLLLQNDLIDEIILSIAPVVLGDGIPLFASSTKQKPFELEKTNTYSNGMVQLKYRNNI